MHTLYWQRQRHLPEANRFCVPLLSLQGEVGSNSESLADITMDVSDDVWELRSHTAPMLVLCPLGMLHAFVRALWGETQQV